MVNNSAGSSTITVRISGVVLLALLLFSTASARADYRCGATSAYPSWKHQFAWALVRESFFEVAKYLLLNHLPGYFCQPVQHPNGHESNPQAGQSAEASKQDESVTRANNQQPTGQASPSAPESTEGQQPPEDHNSEENKADSGKNYFMTPEALDELLQQLSQEAEKRHAMVTLSFDIDDTIYFRKDNRDQPEALYTQQAVMLNAVHEWLHSGSGKERFILIYNTARIYFPNAPWEFLLRNEKLPLPHILIHSNGARVAVPTTLPEHLADLAEQREDFLRRTRKLSDSLKEQEDMDSRTLLNIFGPEEELQLSEVIADGHKSGTVQTTLSTVEAFASPWFGLLRDKYQMTSNLPGSCRGLYLDHEKQYLLYFDRSVNKGTALALVMSWLIRMLPRDTSLMLYTAGDDIYDLPMLFPKYLGQIFVPEIFRKDPTAAGDLKSLGLEALDQARLQAIFQKAMIPRPISKFMTRMLRQLKLTGHPELHQLERVGMDMVLQAVLQHLQSPP